MSAIPDDALGFPDHVVGTGGFSVFSDTAADDKVCLLEDAASRIPDKDNPFFTSAHSCSRGSALRGTSFFRYMPVPVESIPAAERIHAAGLFLAAVSLAHDVRFFNKTLFFSTKFPKNGKNLTVNDLQYLLNFIRNG